MSRDLRSGPHDGGRGSEGSVLSGSGGGGGGSRTRGWYLVFPGEKKGLGAR